MLVMVNYHWFPSDLVTWSCWLCLIMIDFPQTLSLGHVGYGKLFLISLRLCHLAMLVMGNYSWFPSYFVTWSCWLCDDNGEIIIAFPQILSLGHVGYVMTMGKLSLISLRLCHVVILSIGRPWGKQSYLNKTPFILVGLSFMHKFSHLIKVLWSLLWWYQTKEMDLAYNVLEDTILFKLFLARPEVLISQNLLIRLLSKILDATGETQNNGKSIDTYICSIHLPKEIKTEIQFFPKYRRTEQKYSLVRQKCVCDLLKKLVNSNTADWIFM